ncbi:MAG: hypothetical protein GY786_12655 [Proteobacteria bacterium]|nr:hypothetical protein [Pseudomonadota bacterium]
MHKTDNLTNKGCSTCGGKSPNEINVVLPTGVPYSPDIEILADGKVTLKLYGSQKSAFWSDFAKIYQAMGSWTNFPIIPVNYQGQEFRLKFNWKEFIPGSGLYPFDQL